MLTQRIANFNCGNDIMYKSFLEFAFVLAISHGFLNGKLLASADVVTTFVAVKSFNGDAMCAITPLPIVEVQNVSTSIYCASQCGLNNGISYCLGFNFKSYNKTCELISVAPLAFGTSRGCKYFRVGIRFLDLIVSSVR
jgi:hypothetical protein